MPDPSRDARRLIAYALGIPADRVTLVANDPMAEDARLAFDALVGERARRRPVSHLVAGRWFRGRWFTVTADTLDPRPETETLIETALEVPFDRVLDLGTGTGCIAVTLLAEAEGARGVATDISGAALAIAGRNADAHRVSDHLQLLQSDWWQRVDGRFDLIVSNPPYISADEMADMSPELAYEPRQALTDEGDGLAAYRAICEEVVEHLSPGGRLIVEVGATQADAVTAMLKKCSFRDVQTRRDLDGRARVVLGHL